MQTWNLLVQHALMGTEKKQLSPAELGEDLYVAMEALQTDPPADAAEQLLQMAALAANYHQAGQEPVNTAATNTLQPAPAESNPYCNTTAAALLKEVFEAESLGLLQYWIEQCASAGQLAQPVSLPVLIDLATKSPTLQPGIIAVGGRRAQWLSALNPTWNNAAAPSDSETWQTGTTEERITALKTIRAEDAGLSRLWVTETWATETANVRARILEVLHTNLSEHDLPLLQQLQNDKSQKVKDALAELYRKLPGSPLVQEIKHYLQQVFSLKKERTVLGFGSKWNWTIAETPLPNPAWFKMGIEKLSNKKEYTDAEYLVYQLLQWIPPAAITEITGYAPPELLQFVIKEPKWLPAYGGSALQFEDSATLQLIADKTDFFHPLMLPLLPPASREKLVLTHFAGNEATIINKVFSMRENIPLNVAQKIVEKLTSNPFQHRLPFELRTGVHLLPVELAEKLGENTQSDQLRHLLQLKKRILQAFN